MTEQKNTTSEDAAATTAPVSAEVEDKIANELVSGNADQAAADFDKATAGLTDQQKADEAEVIAEAAADLIEGDDEGGDEDDDVVDPVDD